MKRRIKCDGARPGCQKCSRKGLHCPGYGIRYRFNQSHHRASTSVFETGTTVTVHKVPGALLWPDGSRTTSADLPVALYDRPLVPQSTDPQKGYLSVQAVGEPHPEKQKYQDRCLIPRSLETIDSSTRELFAHFSTKIAPVMVVVDSDGNGYRHLLLPLAHTDELVRNAIRVTALDFLASNDDTLRHRSERATQGILSELRARASSEQDLIDVSAWATVILLLTAEIITGGSSFPRLFTMLQHLRAANMANNNSSDLHGFLTAQTEMMSFFAQPLVQEAPDSLRLASRPESTLEALFGDFAFRTDLSFQLDLYKKAIRIACSLYIIRATLNPCYSNTTLQLDHLRALCEPIQPTTPGQHILVWVYFIAAAESSTSEHRQFFTGRLRNLHASTKFRNIPVALAALQKLWSVRHQRRWTEALSELAPIFII
jgi:hypothetical protein